MSIENAAREIAGYVEYQSEGNVALEIERIIRRHLFPSVKPEEVEREKFYWIKSQGVWTAELGGWISHYDDVDEIRGPVPSVE